MYISGSVLYFYLRSFFKWELNFEDFMVQLKPLNKCKVKYNYADNKPAH